MLVEQAFSCDIGTKSEWPYEGYRMNAFITREVENFWGPKMHFKLASNLQILKQSYHNTLQGVTLILRLEMRREG